ELGDAFSDSSVVVDVVELGPDLTALMAAGVDVHVGRTGANRSHQLVERAGLEALWSGCEDVRSGDRSGDRSSASRARLRTSRTVAEVRAQEHDDRSRIGPVLEVNVSLQDVGLEIRERQRVVDGGLVVVQTGGELTDA